MVEAGDALVRRFGALGSRKRTNQMPVQFQVGELPVRFG
jgi:hypothetical protein